MPLLQNHETISKLRVRNPILTHTSWQKLDVIQPQRNVDTYHEEQGNIVCATSDSLQRDFCNETPELVNHAFSFKQNGTKNKLFIFEKMSNSYYEHQVSSGKFVPVIDSGKEYSGSEDTFTSGGWITKEPVKPLAVHKETKEEVLARTKAGVYTVLDKERYVHCDPKIHEKLCDPDEALTVIKDMVSSGILRCEKQPQTCVFSVFYAG